jgi:hypothetical protein
MNPLFEFLDLSLSVLVLINETHQANPRGWWHAEIIRSHDRLEKLNQTATTRRRVIVALWLLHIRWPDEDRAIAL